jgi:hypothetical protein
MASELYKETFAEVGVVKMDCLLALDALSEVRELVYSRMARLGCWRDGAWVDPESREIEKRLRTSLKACSKSAKFNDLVTLEVSQIASELVDGQVVQPMAPRIQLLFTSPGAHVGDDGWAVPSSFWRLDYPRLGELGPPDVQMFACLDQVAPGGGGTLVVAGPHRLLNDLGIIRSKDLKKRLKKDAYFRDLTDKFAVERNRFLTEPGRVDGVPLKVLELCGEPGDIYFTDLRLLHSLGPNLSNIPRLMMT